MMTNSKRHLIRRTLTASLTATLIASGASIIPATLALAAPGGTMASAEASSYTVTYALGTWGSMPGYGPMTSVTQTKQEGVPLTLLTAIPTCPVGTTIYQAQVDANGGQFADGTSTATIRAYLGGNMIFQGYLGSDGKSYSPGDTYSTDADLTLTAQWGDGSHIDLLPVVTRDGYRCIGYYTARDGGDFVGNPGEMPGSALYQREGLTAYARWEAINGSGQDDGNNSNSGNQGDNSDSPSDGNQGSNGQGGGSQNGDSGTTDNTDGKANSASNANGNQTGGQSGQTSTRTSSGTKTGDLVATGELSSRGALITFITAAVSACGWTVARKLLRRS